MDQWMGGRVDGWVDGWMDGWMDRWMESSHAEKDLGVLGHERWDTTRPCALAAQKIDRILGYIKKVWAAGRGRRFCGSYHVLFCPPDSKVTFCLH